MLNFFGDEKFKSFHHLQGRFVLVMFLKVIWEKSTRGLKKIFKFNIQIFFLNTEPCDYGYNPV